MSEYCQWINGDWSDMITVLQKIKERIEMNKFLKNKFAKCIFVYVIPIIIGGVFSALGTWDLKNDSLFLVKLILLIVLLLWYVFTSFKYSRFEKDLNEEISQKEEKIDELLVENEKQKQVSSSFFKETQKISTLCLDSSNSINELGKKVLEGKRTLDVWNFTKVATGICSSIYEVLCCVSSPNDEFTVNILLDDITATGKKRNYTMIAHKGKFEEYPSKFQEKMVYKEHPNFYATKLFKSGKADIKILTTKEEVNEKFVYGDEDDHPEYSQYVGIPIVCSGNRMICLLQICAFGNDKIADTKKGIMDIVKTYILPFAQFALLNYKVEKGFLSSLSVIGKLEGKNNGN